MRLIRAFLVAIATILSTMAFAGDAEVKAAQGTIEAQLKAFQAGDGESAYSYAAPNIKQMFPSQAAFMAMVEGGYAPVFRSSNAVFGKMTPEGKGFRQEVYLTDTSGQSYIASYTLERQPDGSVKITSCAIRKGTDVSA